MERWPFFKSFISFDSTFWKVTLNISKKIKYKPDLLYLYIHISCLYPCPTLLSGIGTFPLHEFYSDNTRAISLSQCYGLLCPNITRCPAFKLLFKYWIGCHGNLIIMIDNGIGFEGTASDFESTRAVFLASLIHNKVIFLLFYCTVCATEVIYSGARYPHSEQVRNLYGTSM